MSLQTQIARRLFRHDQIFMAKRKLRIVLLVIAVSMLVSVAFFGMVYFANAQR
jgi:hypothetical protein